MEVRQASLAKTAEKEVQDTSCRGYGGVPQLIKSPKIGGYRGVIESISAVFKDKLVASIVAYYLFVKLGVLCYTTLT